MTEQQEVPRGASALLAPTWNAIFAPAKAFEALDARPILGIWPILWVTAAMMFLGVLNLSVTRQVMRVSMVQGMAQRGQNLDADQLRQSLEVMDRFAPAWAIGGNLFIILGVLLIAVAIWMGASMLGGRTQFSRSMSVAAVGSVVHPLLNTVFVSTMWYFNPPEIRRVEDFFAALPSLGLDLFLGAEPSMITKNLLMRVDLFNIWWMVLVVLGCEKMLGVKRGGAIGIAGVIWAVSTALSVFWTSLSG